MLKKIKKILIGDASTDIDLRYVPVAESIRKNKTGDRKILEIGSGDLGITPYYSGEVVGLDISFDQPDSPRLKKIKIDGPVFPFNDNDFELSISVDALEHIRPEERPAYLKEIFRVTEKLFILELPIGSLAYEQDRELGDYYLKIHQREDKFIREHLLNNLPSAADLRRELSIAADGAGKRIEIIEEKKLFNLKMRRMLMRFKISRSRFKKIIYYCFSPLARYYRLFNFGECYRRLFIIRIK